MSIHNAVMEGRLDAVLRCLSEGLDPDTPDFRRFTPLHHAAGLGAADIVEALLHAGADASARNTFQNTPLHAIAHGGGRADAATRIRIVELLLAAGSPLEALDSVGRTPLWYAAATGTAPQPPEVMNARLAVVQLLLARGADPGRAANGKQGTPLDAARGLHQSKKYRIVWPEAVTVIEAAARR